VVALSLVVMTFWGSKKKTRTPRSSLCMSAKGSSEMPGDTLMLIVLNNPAHVESELRAGRLACPHCEGELRPWGHARRRVLRTQTEDEEHRPRRPRCSNCHTTSVLLPDVCLSRRVDEVAVTGRALLEKAAGAGHRTIAIRLARPRETVRGWLRRFSSRIVALQEHFLRWAFALDPRLEQVTPQGSPFADALEAIGLATRAASLLFGPRPVWSWVSAMTGGQLLANTNSPFPSPTSLVSGTTRC
jgi:transposase-like protein